MRGKRNPNRFKPAEPKIDCSLTADAKPMVIWAPPPEVLNDPALLKRYVREMTKGTPWNLETAWDAIDKGRKKNV